MDLNAKELIVFLTDPTAAATNIAITTGYVSFLHRSFGLALGKLLVQTFSELGTFCVRDSLGRYPLWPFLI